jgi:arginase family enzyme
LPDDIDCLLVHFDLDVVDFLDFPATDYPTVNAGLQLSEALACIAELARHPKFAALTICELSRPRGRGAPPRAAVRRRARRGHGSGQTG